MTTRIDPRLFVLLAALQVGCAGGRYGVDPASIQRPAAELLSEAQVVTLAAAADSALIRQARLAERRGSSNAVRALGQQIAEDADAMNRRLLSTAAASGIRPAPHPLPDQLGRGGQEVIAELEASSQEAFDETYLRRQVALSHWFLALLDHSLLPSSHDEALRAHLAAVRARTASYLEAARAARSS